MSERTDDVVKVARELRASSVTWAPDVRLVGNVRAADIARVCEAVSDDRPRVRELAARARVLFLRCAGLGLDIAVPRAERLRAILDGAQIAPSELTIGALQSVSDLDLLELLTIAGDAFVSVVERDEPAAFVTLLGRDAPGEPSP